MLDEDQSAEPPIDLGLPVADPAQHGFVPDRLARAMELIAEGVDSGAYPGAVAIVARHDEIVAASAVGSAELGASPRPMRLDTIFDLASVTKVVAGVSAVLLMLDAGLLCLDDSISRFLPGFAAGEKRAITLRHLLTHTAGLPPWLPCYTIARTADETFAYLQTVELEARPGMQVQYSDLGMALLRAVVREVAGEDLPALLDRALFRPLGMRETGYCPATALRHRMAATELGNRFEQRMVERAGLHFADRRTELLVGEVNDGNTHYALEGISSHAGLFAPAADLVRFGRFLLQRGEWQGRMLLSPVSIALATRNHTAGLQASYGLGWRINVRPSGPVLPPVRSDMTKAIFPDDPAAPPANWWAGDLLPADTFGHTGFSGTAITICPSLDMLLILLTNRIHPDADRQGLERVRACWHNAVAASISPTLAPATGHPAGAHLLPMI
jgi:CubicO group peptidase (beta-lactamase class C family)